MAADRRLRWKALFGILFRGNVRKRDFLAFLEHPLDRIEKVRLYRREALGARYRFTGENDNLAGLTVEWESKTAHFPDNFTPAQRQLIENVLFQPRPPDRGIMTAYCKEWYGRIAGYYRGSRTKLIFLQVPAAPVPPPPFPRKPNGAIQIYFDFSGYTDMAIGMAKLLGFHFPINFRRPYLASSMTDF